MSNISLCPIWKAYAAILSKKTLPCAKEYAALLRLPNATRPLASRKQKSNPITDSAYFALSGFNLDSATKLLIVETCLPILSKASLISFSNSSCDVIIHAARVSRPPSNVHEFRGQQDP